MPLNKLHAKKASIFYPTYLYIDSCNMENNWRIKIHINYMGLIPHLSYTDFYNELNFKFVSGARNKKTPSTHNRTQTHLKFNIQQSYMNM